MQQHPSRNFAPDSPAEFLVHSAQFLAPTCAVGLLLPILTLLLAGYQNPLVWLIDLASHWQWLFLAGLVISSLIAALQGRRWLLWLVLMPAPWLTASAPAQSDSEPLKADRQVLSIASANVHLGNTDTAPLRDWLSKTNPDVVVLLEVSPIYAEGLDRLSGYPYRHIEPRESPFGMALLSRHPFAKAHTVQDSEFVIHIDATVNWLGQSIKVVGIHPMPPLSPEFHEARNSQLHGIAEAMQQTGLPTILAGDLNTTPWGSAFDGLNVKSATSLQPTWPSRYFGIPIDHVLASSHWRVVDAEVGPDIGSDHHPVLVTLTR